MTLSRFLLLSVLASTSVAQAGPLEVDIWRYTSCTNTDQVKAHADQSKFTLLREASGSEISFEWSTTLFQGYDEMMPTDASGAVVANSKAVSDPKPVSASWKLILKNIPETSTYQTTGYALVSSQSGANTSKEFSSLPGLVRYIDAPEMEDRIVVLAQSVGQGKYWISAYTPGAMVREEVTLNEDGRILMSTVARSCGTPAATSALSLNLAKREFKSIPVFPFEGQE